MEKFELLMIVWCLVCAWGIAAVSGETKTFRSPVFSLGPGDVVNNYYSIEMPAGHVGVRSFNGEVVDEDGNPIPLSEVYLHHWIASKMHVKKKAVGFGQDRFIVRNDGTCQDWVLDQFYGLGSETRRTDYYLPEPYVLETGNPHEIPDGYEEQWLLNVHAIDTRGAVNPAHCLECRCASYNVSVTEYGRKVPEEYIGGLECCLHGYRCALKEGVHETKRNLYFQYTVEYFPMEPSLKPVRVYIADVTDNRTSPEQKPRCQVEYTVAPCEKSTDLACRHEKHALAWLPEKKEVDVVFVAGHLHAGGVSVSMHGQDGREICTADAIYGTGHEAGNEAGYVVGMRSCYPEGGPVKIKPGETLHLRAVYDSEDLHTGVMGLLYIVVADPLTYEREGPPPFLMISAAVLVIAVAVAIIVISLTRYVRFKRSNVGYESLVQA